MLQCRLLTNWNNNSIIADESDNVGFFGSHLSSVCRLNLSWEKLVLSKGRVE